MRETHRITRWQLPIAALIAMAAIVACDRTVTAPSAHRLSVIGARHAAQLAQTGHIPMLDELFEAVNAQAPGFGGMYRSGRSTITILVTPKGTNVAVEQAARAVFSEYAWDSITAVKFAPARFEVLELQRLRARLPEIGGNALIWSDFDEASNLVRVGVDESADLVQLANGVRALGAEDGAVVFVHDKRPQPAQLLTASHRPMLGGIQISIYDTSITHAYGAGQFATCTLGFNAELTNDQYDTYFVTAGHCTGNIWGYQAADAYQPDSATNPARIATLWALGDGYSGLSGCPSGYLCKYSDAALFQYVSSNIDWSFLAKDSSFSSSPGTNGSLFRVDSFQVNGDIPEADLLGADTVSGSYDTYLHKVGRTTGWTWGPEVNSCLTYYVTANRALLCQYRIAAQVDYGDSGAPTFWWQFPGVNKAWIGGILNSAVPYTNYIFSSITGIQNDMAHLGWVMVTH